MEAASKSLFYGLAEILVKVLQVAYSQLAEILVPMFMRTDDAVNVSRGESQVDRKLSPSELVRFPREGDCTGRVRQLFAMVLEGVHILSVINGETRNAAPRGQEAPCAEVDHESAGGKRVANDVPHMRATGRDGREPIRSAGNLGSGQREPLCLRSKPRAERRDHC